MFDGNRMHLLCDDTRLMNLECFEIVDCNNIVVPDQAEILLLHSCGNQDLIEVV